MESTLSMKSMKGRDTEDFLEHIAWTEVILPKLLKTKEILTRQLVDITLNASTSAGAGSREQIAGKIFGIDHTIKTIETIVAEGRKARELMSL